LIACVLSSAACSSDDSRNIANAEAPFNSSNVVGRWLIYKADYINSNTTTLYTFNGVCAKEVLEFTDNKEVSETFYIDDECSSGGTTYYSWWESGDKYQIGNLNSFHHTMTVTDNELIVDASEEGDYIKYYKKAN
jgi:hypothetical protein